MSFTYSDDCISDLHKEVYGYRPRGAYWDDWDNCTPTQKQKTWDEYCRALEIQMAETKTQEEQDVAKFEARVQDVIELGAGNTPTLFFGLLVLKPFITNRMLSILFGSKVSYSLTMVSSWSKTFVKL